MNSSNSKTPSEHEPWQAAHEEACCFGKNTYIDPETGYQVFTEEFLRARGYCCESGCRHCPYGFAKEED